MWLPEYFKLYICFALYFYLDSPELEICLFSPPSTSRDQVSKAAQIHAVTPLLWKTYHIHRSFSHIG